MDDDVDDAIGDTATRYGGIAGIAPASTVIGPAAASVVSTGPANVRDPFEIVPTRKPVNPPW
jgi:hypothetical protein